MPNVPSTQPAIMKPTEEHPAYTQIAKVSSCYMCRFIWKIAISITFAFRANYFFI